LGTRKYARQRLGIGRLESGVRQITGHVLGRFSADEAEVFERVLRHAVSQATCWLDDGIEKAMARYNGSGQVRTRNAVKRYEGLFILNTAGKEEGVKDVIDHISADITAAGGKVDTVQKMDKRPFARVASRKHAIRLLRQLHLRE
jgi:hypothetical protein